MSQVGARALTASIADTNQSTQDARNASKISGRRAQLNLGFAEVYGTLGQFTKQSEKAKEAHDIQTLPLTNPSKEPT